MYSEAYTVVSMTKKKRSASRSRVYPVRNFPSELLERLQKLKTETGINVYVFFRDAVREKLDREYPEKETK
jgi:hypothetical protein